MFTICALGAARFLGRVASSTAHALCDLDLTRHIKIHVRTTTTTTTQTSITPDPPGGKNRCSSKQTRCSLHKSHRSLLPPSKKSVPPQKKGTITHAHTNTHLIHRHRHRGGRFFFFRARGWHGPRWTTQPTKRVPTLQHDWTDFTHINDSDNTGSLVCWNTTETTESVRSSSGSKRVL